MAKPKRVVIIANGNIQNPSLTKTYLHPTDFIICADGGVRHLDALGVQPHLVVGDLDSAPPAQIELLAGQGIAIERHPINKNETDLELALHAAANQHAHEILLLGLLGGRLDQQLANILLLTRPAWRKIHLVLVDGPQWGYLLHGPGHRTLNGTPGDTLSIIPLSAQIDGLTLGQVDWPLRNKTVLRGSTLTISNQFKTQTAKISLASGIALVTHIQQT